MPDVRIALTDNEKKKWGHVKIDIGGNGHDVFIYLIDFYNKNKGRQII